MLNNLLSEERLVIQDLQNFHRQLDQEKHFDQDIFRNIAYLTGEVGELVTALRKLRMAKESSEEAQARQLAGEELADCLAYIIKLANYADVDLHKAYVEKMRKNLKREWHPAIK